MVLAQPPADAHQRGRPGEIADYRDHPVARLQSLQELKPVFRRQVVLLPAAAVDGQQEIAQRRVVRLRPATVALEAQPEPGVDETAMEPVDGLTVRIAQRDPERRDGRSDSAPEASLTAAASGTPA